MLHLNCAVNLQDEFYSGNALFLIAKIHIADRNFSDAYSTLLKAIENNFQSKRLQLLFDFTEGVLYLIKRKVKKGIQKLSDLIEILKEDDFLYA